MRIVFLLWLGFGLLWGVLVHLVLTPTPIFGLFWWTNTVGHCTFGALWVYTCLNKYWFQLLVPAKNVTLANTLGSLLVVALFWELLEFSGDYYFHVPGTLPIQKGWFDTTSDIVVALASGYTLWVFSFRQRAGSVGEENSTP